VRPRYLKERANDYAFVHVDCAGLAGSDEAEILGEIAAQLRYEGFSMDDAHPSKVPRSMRHVLRERILSVEPSLNLVLVLDYFDGAAAELDKSFFNYLFHLRNSRPRGNLSYIFATRRPMGHLGELQELLDDGCIVGPLSHKDGLGSIRRDEARLGCAFSAAQRNRLISCTGGHPGFLKNAAELLCSGQVDTSLPGEKVARQLLQSGRVEDLCEELWNDLTPAEQSVLLEVTRNAPPSRSLDDARAAYMEQSGLLARKGDRQVIFCPLFETFVRDKSKVSGLLRILAVFPNQARIETSMGEERITLSPKLFALLLALTEAGGRVVSTDELISRVYGDEAAGVTDAALSQLVKRLRGVLNPRVRSMMDDPVYTCVETIRGVGYSLNG
ncbi:MAG: winged helix-turn-helix domain-containing protein, partial [Chloroflexota bacterium]|nr:winged helix-turn-helix domain-containing protein [Chloroflexota bacterium]